MLYLSTFEERMLVQKYKNKDHPADKATNYTARKDLKTAQKNFDMKLASNIKTGF